MEKNQAPTQEGRPWVKIGVGCLIVVIIFAGACLVFGVAAFEKLKGHQSEALRRMARITVNKLQNKTDEAAITKRFESLLTLSESGELSFLGFSFVTKAHHQMLQDNVVSSDEAKGFNEFCDELIQVKGQVLMAEADQWDRKVLKIK